MRKSLNIFFTVGMLCSLAMASFVIAASPGSQPLTPQGSPQSNELPDINAYKLEAFPESPKSGEIVYLKGFYSVTGCVSKTFFGKIQVDNSTILKEQELKNFCPDCTNPNCKLWWDYFLEAQWKAVPGIHTITFTVDSKNNIFEGPLKENNNSRSVTISVPLPNIPVPKEINKKPIIPQLQQPLQR